MLNSTEQYKAAITENSRHILPKAIIDIIDPDIVYNSPVSSGDAAYSKPEQLMDKILEQGRPYATLERNRWILNGKFDIAPADPAAITRQVGSVLEALSGDDGTFSDPVWVEERFSGVTILQACSVYFPDSDYDGFPVDFTVEVKQGGTAYFTQTVTGNTERSVKFTGFTVNNPDAIRVTVSKWSLPHRRVRVMEIIPGIYEIWDNNIIAAFNVVQQGNFSCLALPYGTCRLSMDNLDRRFEPRSKDGVFQSIEERQDIDVSIGVELEDGTTDYKRVGIFYQFSGGWKTGDNGLTMQWNLVDIVGLIANREYVVPDTLPTTLDGWVASVVAQLGSSFEDRYHVDPDYAHLPLTVDDVSEVTGKKCGDILRWACMATGTWPRADASTGNLAVEPFWNQGNKLTLDNMNTYPVMSANNDLAAIIFTLHDENSTKYVVSGNSTASSDTVSVDNPFIKTEKAALTAARLILSNYGGNRLEVTGRGDPSSEIGDVDTVWLNESIATTGRRQSQTFQIQNGVMQGCKSVLLQADGSFLYQNRTVITKSGMWTAPADVTALRLILVGKGEDGTAGTDGTWDEAGVDGADGAGGRVWAGVININDGQTFTVEVGENTIFGEYSSANGHVYEYGYTDIASGDSFARTGVLNPLPGSGDGGAGGVGGVKGNRHEERKTIYVQEGEDWIGGVNTAPSVPTQVTVMTIDNYPGTGTPGVAGAIGCAVVYWDKGENE